jgi:DNA sulfur modification protein DndD
LKEKRRDLEELALSIKLAEERRAYARKVSVELRSALEAGKCGTCGHELGDSAQNAIRERIERYSVDSTATSRAEELQIVEKQLSAIKELEPRISQDYLLELQEQLDQGRVNTASINSRIHEIFEQTRNADESEVRRLQSEHDSVVGDMTLIAEGIRNEQKELDDTSVRLQKVQEDLKKVAGHDLAKYRRKREMCQKLHALFSSAVDVYRERLRSDVATDATDLFLQLTTEPEYRELQINENYGLSIVHQSGQTISIRSAGAEHVVALSLMGALQKNAPLRGPIIMDSPFGRLDSGHTERVVKTLPLMASQSILLVYESELEPDLARGVLGDDLRREYKIVRKSARHSSLERQV